MRPGRSDGWKAAATEPTHSNHRPTTLTTSRPGSMTSRMAEVRGAMAQIPAHERTTIELVLWSGLSLAQAAAVLQVAEGTVKSRLARGRSHLARLLEQASTDSEDLS